MDRRSLLGLLTATTATLSTSSASAAPVAHDAEVVLTGFVPRARALFEAAATEAELRKLFSDFLGKDGEITPIIRGLSREPASRRAELGVLINRVCADITEAFRSRLAVLHPGPADVGEDVRVFHRSAATHSDFPRMLKDVRKWVDVHPGATVLSSDDPCTRCIGFTAFVVDGGHEVSQHFAIPLTSVACSGPFPGRELLGSAPGRKQLAKDLERGTV